MSDVLRYYLRFFGLVCFLVASFMLVTAVACGLMWFRLPLELGELSAIVAAFGLLCLLLAAKGKMESCTIGATLLCAIARVVWSEPSSLLLSSPAQELVEMTHPFFLLFSYCALGVMSGSVQSKRTCRNGLVFFCFASPLVLFWGDLFPRFSSRLAWDLVPLAVATSGFYLVSLLYLVKSCFQLVQEHLAESARLAGSKSLVSSSSLKKLQART